MKCEEHLEPLSGRIAIVVVSLPSTSPLTNFPYHVSSINPTLLHSMYALHWPSYAKSSCIKYFSSLTHVQIRELDHLNIL